jgi:hypothetical protein
MARFCCEQSEDWRDPDALFLVVAFNGPVAETPAEAADGRLLHFDTTFERLVEAMATCLTQLGGTDLDHTLDADRGETNISYCITAQVAEMPTAEQMQEVEVSLARLYEALTV